MGCRARQPTEHLQQHGGRAPTGSRDHARPLPCPAEQDLLQLGSTTLCISSDRLQRGGFQRGGQKALVTPLVTEFGRPSQPITPWTMTPTKQASWSTQLPAPTGSILGERAETAEEMRRKLIRRTTSVPSRTKLSRDGEGVVEATLVRKRTSEI